MEIKFDCKIPDDALFGIKQTQDNKVLFSFGEDELSMANIIKLLRSINKDHFDNVVNYLQDKITINK